MTEIQTDDRYRDYDQVLGFVVNRASAALRSTLSAKFALAGFKTTPDEFAILTRVAAMQSSSQSTLVSETFRDAPAVSRALRSLVEQGLVECNTDPTDRRARVVVLTTVGIRQLEKLKAIANSNLDCAEHGVSVEELATTINVLQRVWANLVHTTHLETELPK